MSKLTTQSKMRNLLYSTLKRELNTELQCFGLTCSLPCVILPQLTLSVLVCFAGVMSGLTVGYLSIDKLDLEIKQSIGTESEKRAVSFHSFYKRLGQCHIAHLEAAPFPACNTSSL